MHIDINIKILHKNNKDFIPNIASIGSAGLDLYACVNKDVIMEPNKNYLIGTGIAIHIANPDYAGLILARSGMSHKHELVLSNSVGLIDSDYTGELKVSLRNIGSKSYILEPYTRMAQLIVININIPRFNIVEDLESTARSDSGFGSTGIF